MDRDRDREDWLRLLDRVATRSNWRVFSGVLVGNHFNLFPRTPEPNLSAGMHDLNSGYASLFNRRYRRVGSLFQGRFKAILVENEALISDSLSKESTIHRHRPWRQPSRASFSGEPPGWKRYVKDLPRSRWTGTCHYGNDLPGVPPQRRSSRRYGVTFMSRLRSFARCDATETKPAWWPSTWCGV